MKTIIHAVLIVFGIIVVLIAATRTWRSLETTQANKAKIGKILAQNEMLKGQLPPSQNQTAATKRAANTSNMPASMTVVERIKKSDLDAKLLEERLKKDPLLQKKEFAVWRTFFEREYGPFFRLAGLSPAEREKFTAARQAQSETQDDINALKTSGQYDPKDPVWRTLEKETQDATTSAEREILGDEGFAQLEEYNREYSAWEYAGDTAAGLDLAGTPMTFEQTKKLVDTIVAATPVDPKSNDLLSSKTDWDAVENEAQNFLTPEQFKVFSSPFLNSAKGGRLSRQLDTALDKAIKAETAKSTLSEPTPGTETQ